MQGHEEVTRKHRFATVLVVGGSPALLRHAGAASVAIGAVVRPVSPEAAIVTAAQHEALAIVLGPGLSRATRDALRDRAARVGAALVELGEDEPDDHVRLETHLRAATSRRHAA